MRKPTLLQALVPLFVLVVLLVLSVRLFGDGSSGGPNQIALLMAAGAAMLVALRNGLRYADMQLAVVKGVSLTTTAIFILLAVGALIGAWILSGTVPALIYYGMKLLHPSWFYPAVCLICALVALSIGSSWTVAGTIGVALMGVALGLGLDPAIAAGAVISGAYFGDKMSPLSDTTNLAPASAGSELFSHIRHMTWTTLPGFAAALLIFTGIGLSQAGQGDTGALEPLLAALDARFDIGVHLLLPLLVLLVMAVRKVPAFPTIAIGALLGAVFAVLFQREAVLALAGVNSDNTALQLVGGAWRSLFDGYSADSGDSMLDSLLNRGGMASMLPTIWLIVCAMAFGACMERAGLLDRIVESILRAVRGPGSLVVATILTAIGVNVIASDQYIAIVLPGRLYRLEFDRQGLEPVNLSRAIEDGGTLTSALVPWNTCGAYMAATLGVATLDYLPYAFFNWITPIIAMAMAVVGYKLLRKPVAVRA
ncbi:MAG: Na+/H+ antiporter NhaC [Xanthomonadales bacterium]|nr:Na+/H+ antiporter NhaC [Xanthomonadales bacterium]